MALPDSIAKLPKRLSSAFTSRRAIAASPLVAVALVAGIAMASNRTDPAKVETREDVAAPTRRVVSTSQGMSDALDAKAKTKAKKKAKAKAKAKAGAKAKKAKADATAKPDGQAPAPQPAADEQAAADPVPTTPPGESDQLRAPESGQPTPLDLTEGLIGPVPPVAWPAGTGAPLTGLGVDSPFGPSGSALAVKVSNAPSAYPQTGLHMADLIYEEPAHGIGDASRFLAIYHSRDVDTVGAVRSARTGDLPLLAPLGRPILAYAGANEKTQFAVDVRQEDGWLVHARENKDGGPAFFRQGPGVTASNLFVSRNNLMQQYRDLTWAPNQQFTWLPDGQQNAGAKPAGRVDMQVAGQRSGFVFDDASKQWVRFQSGRPHVNKTDGSQIGRSSVIVMTTRYQPSHADHASFEAVTFPMPGVPASGQVWVLTGQTVTQGTWTRSADTATFRLNDLNGRAIGLQRGPVFVGLVSTPPTVT